MKKKWLSAVLCVLLIASSIPIAAFAQTSAADAVWDPSAIYLPATGTTNQVSSLFLMNQINLANSTYKYGQLVSSYDTNSGVITLTNKHAEQYNKVYDKILSHNSTMGLGNFIAKNYSEREYLAIDVANNSGTFCGVAINLLGPSNAVYFAPDSNYFLVDSGGIVTKADTGAMAAGLGSGTTNYYCILPPGFSGTLYTELAGYQNKGEYSLSQVQAVSLEIRSAATTIAASTANPQGLELQMSRFRLTKTMPCAEYAHTLTVADSAWNPSIIYLPATGSTNQASSLFLMNQINFANSTYKYGQLVSSYDTKSGFITLTNKHADQYNRVYDKILSYNDTLGMGYFVAQKHAGRNFIALDVCNNSGTNYGMGVSLLGEARVKYFTPDSNYYLIDSSGVITKADNNAAGAGLGSSLTNYYAIIPAGFKGALYIELAGYENQGDYSLSQVQSVAFEIRSAATGTAASTETPQKLELMLGRFRLTQSLPKIISGVSIKSQPEKLIYVKGEELALEGGQLEVRYSGGYYPDELLDMTDASVAKAGFDANAPGLQSVDMSVAGWSGKETLALNVLPSSLRGISVKSAPCVSCALNETVSAKGGVLSLELEDGSKMDIPMDTFGVKFSCDTASAGTTRAAVSYGGFETRFDVEVLDIKMLKHFDSIDGVMITQPAADLYTFAKGSLENDRLKLENIPNEDNDTFFIWSFRSDTMGALFAKEYKGFDYICFDVENNTGKDVIFTAELYQTGSAALVSDGGYMLAEHQKNPEFGDHNALFGWTWAKNRYVVVPRGFSGVIMMSLDDYYIKQGPYNDGTLLSYDDIQTLSVGFRYGGDDIVAGDITVGDIYLCREGFLNIEDSQDTSDVQPLWTTVLLASAVLGCMLCRRIRKRRGAGSC